MPVDVVTNPNAGVVSEVKCVQLGGMQIPRGLLQLSSENC